MIKLNVSQIIRNMFNRYRSTFNDFDLYNFYIPRPVTLS